LAPQAAKAKIAKAQLVRSMIFLDGFIDWFLLMIVVSIIYFKVS